MSSWVPESIVETAWVGIPGTSEPFVPQPLDGDFELDDGSWELSDLNSSIQGDVVYEGAKAALVQSTFNQSVVKNGHIQQRVTLIAGVDYTLMLQVNGDSAHDDQPFYWNHLLIRLRYVGGSDSVVETLEKDNLLAGWNEVTLDEFVAETEEMDIVFECDAHTQGTFLGVGKWYLDNVELIGPGTSTQSPFESEQSPDTPYTPGSGPGTVWSEP